tara:strand:+ start:3237 stop:3425 length:189 start_codon:yes stop_codon:yes gene_type:complete
MEIIALRHRCIFKAHEGRELAGFIILLDGFPMADPQIAGAFFLLFGVDFQCPIFLAQFNSCS